MYRKNNKKKGIRKMKTKKEPKTKASELEIIDDIFMVKKENKKLVGLKCYESNTPEHLVLNSQIH